MESSINSTFTSMLIFTVVIILATIFAKLMYKYNSTKLDVLNWEIIVSILTDIYDNVDLSYVQDQFKELVEETNTKLEELKKEEITPEIKAQINYLNSTLATYNRCITLIDIYFEDMGNINDINYTEHMFNENDGFEDDDNDDDTIMTSEEFKEYLNKKIKDKK